MIAYIKGILTYIQDDSVVVDVGGVGYELICANPFGFQSSLNTEVKINTYHHVREDLQVLYGFKNQDEKYLFTKLISVSGIGPKGALGILGSVDIPAFVAAIEKEDDKFLTGFPGVGKKTARQIILDLKGKLTTMLQVSGTEDTATTEGSPVSTKGLQEAQEALKALGYTDREIKMVVPKLQLEDSANTDEVIRKALALLMKN
ncbi:Holliday junction branch migration protein RuvA [Virgibacillus profundi]|uniref:Holliday junction branch migration complex subunit RuvA n=1 Tax=Virgibacillus profundi TaxID=2024555 RepID=A0A2A2IB29_9BACI|nr:Holliday junction branch migration protein RuvA [Virgibacillus profundi]PAV28929.1 Holliday junction branch migration protein RuvA [Virgibacillus profundi]PXY53097.1 Holliday junction branch migration protein RuvA [Virgibacillus profundi]